MELAGDRGLDISCVKCYYGASMYRNMDMMPVFNNGTYGSVVG
jgi:hypothetical protein